MFLGITVEVGNWNGDNTAFSLFLNENPLTGPGAKCCQSPQIRLLQSHSPVVLVNRHPEGLSIGFSTELRPLWCPRLRPLNLYLWAGADRVCGASPAVHGPLLLQPAVRGHPGSPRDGASDQAERHLPDACVIS
jgi:hypothetical protein